MAFASMEPHCATFALDLNKKKRLFEANPSRFLASPSVCWSIERLSLSATTPAMNNDEEKQFSQLSDSQIRDSMDALFCLPPEQQTNPTAETTNGELPVIQTNPPIETSQNEASNIMADQMTVNKPFSSTASTIPSLSNPAQLNTSHLPTPPMTMTTLLSQIGFMPSPTTTANAMYNPDVLTLLRNATSSTLPTMGFPMVPETILPQEGSQDKIPPSRKRKAATADAALYYAQKTPMVCSEDESEQKHRRTDRNAREQHRAQQITLQIAALRDLLMKTSNIQFKPDKFSTLLTAAQYIRQLQNKQQTLTAEHQSLLRTLKKTSEALQRSATGGAENENAKVDQLSETFIHQGIPYRVLFQMCPAPMCLVRMDGCFLDANAMFEQLLNTKTDRLKAGDTTFFNVLDRSSIENVFCAMSRLLEVPSSLISSDLTEVASGSDTTSVLSDSNADMEPVPNPSSYASKSVVSMTSSNSNDSDSSEQSTKDSFTEDVVLAHNAQKASLRITIVRNEQTQIPRFFACTFCIAETHSGTSASSVSSTVTSG